MDQVRVSGMAWRAIDVLPGRVEQRSQLRGRRSALDLEVGELRHLACHPGEQRHAERDARQGSVLDHDGDVEALADRSEMLEHTLVVRSQQRAMVRRHHHDHRGSFGCGPAAAFDCDSSAEMAAGHDDGHLAIHVLEAHGLQQPPFLVGEKELLGVVGEDAQTVDALVDHAVENAALAFEVKRAFIVEWRRNDREDPAIGRCHR